MYPMFYVPACPAGRVPFFQTDTLQEFEIEDRQFIFRDRYKNKSTSDALRFRRFSICKATPLHSLAASYC